MEDKEKISTVEELINGENQESFIKLLNAVERKQRILLIGQIGAHGLATLASTLLMQGDSQGMTYEIFDAELMKDRRGMGKLYTAHIQSEEEICKLLSLWANGDSGIATMYADALDHAFQKIDKALRKYSIKDPTAFMNCTIDVICMVENEDESCQNSVIRDIIVMHQ